MFLESKCYSPPFLFIKSSSGEGGGHYSQHETIFTHYAGSGRVLANPLAPVFGKILEKLIYDSLYQHLASYDLLNPCQSGFRHGDSTINQLLSITHTIFKAFDCNPPCDVRSVYLDISKAFDRVWHDGLLYKLERCGISGQLLFLVKSFLKDRKQRTV